MFIYVMSFFATGSKGGRFLTQDYLLQRKIKIRNKAVKEIFNLYKMTNFNVNTAILDIKLLFVYLHLPVININTSARNDHS